jgi:mycothiol system anti-sigma-R factor
MSESQQVTPGQCADFLEQIVYLIDNELTPDEQAEVKGHIESCGPCLDKYDLQRTVKTVVARSCSESAPDELRSRIMVRIQQIRVEISE